MIRKLSFEADIYKNLPRAAEAAQAPRPALVFSGTNQFENICHPATNDGRREILVITKNPI